MKSDGRNFLIHSFRISITLFFLFALIGVPGAIPARAASGGPDGGGYYWVDSAGTNFQDMTGATTIVVPDGTVSAAVPIGFNFTFYGTSYSNIYICDNGLVQFAYTAQCNRNAERIPGDQTSGKHPYPMIAMWWADWYTDAGGTISYITVGSAPNRVFVVHFNGIPQYIGDPVNIQVKLFETINEVEVHYNAAPVYTDPITSDSNHTAGIQGTATIGLEYYYGTAAITNMTVRYYKDAGVLDTTILTHPNNPSNSSSGTFTFSGSGGVGALTFECQIDGGGFSACTSPQNYTSLSEGSHTFQVRSVDSLNNVDPTPASYTWTVDTLAPETSITSQPTNPTNSNSASFSFTGSDVGGSGVASYQCQLDSGGYSTCTSPKSYTSLSEGAHTFYVRAVDNAGNTDASPASYTWVVDTTPPNTTITANPTNPTSSTSASFSFTGNDGVGTGVASFECRLDAGGYGACTSPQNFTSLSDGSHTFYVRAIDQVGNVDASPATFTWVVDTIAPNTTITSHPGSPTNQTSATFTFTGNDGTGSGVASFQCQIDGGGFSVCTSSKTYTGLSDGSHTFDVYAVDNAGNIDPTPDSFTWVINTVAPPTPVLTSPADGTVIASTSVKLQWQASTGAQGYRVVVDSAAPQDVGAVLELDLTALTRGSHTWSVAAYDNAGNTSTYATNFTFIIVTPEIYFPVISKE